MADEEEDGDGTAAIPPAPEMLHVDEFVAGYRDPSYEHQDKAEFGDLDYARWFLMLHRLPAMMQSDFRKYIEPFKLYCTYNNVRFRCTGASRMGDVWLTTHMDKDQGYELRVDLAKCRCWGDKP
jgi:hypothetical protein